MREFIRECPTGKIIVLVPSVALLDQWIVSLQHDVGVPQSDIYVIRHSTRPADLRTLNLCVINTARNLLVELTANGSYFLCVDECHRAGSPANATALTGRFSAVLGLSATPRRQYDDGFESRVAPVLGEVIFEYSFPQALSDGVVTPFLLRNYRIPLTLAEKQAFTRITRKIAAALGGNPTSSENLRVERLLHQRASVILSARWRVPAAVSLALQFTKPTIIFHERQRAANEIAELLERRGLRTGVYHTGLSAGIRQRNLAMFREGVLKCLVACRSLDEGVNIPEAEIGIMAASSRSLRQRVQRLGRVLRRAPGKEMATVCTLYATDVEETALREEGSVLNEIVSAEWYSVGLRNV
jgi:superfamily II DNA or RNA helicase